MPEISDLINRRSESETIGILLRFHGSLEYGFKGCVSIVGIALGAELARKENNC